MVDNIAVFLPRNVISGLPTSSEPARHDGSSIETAIVLGTHNEDTGVHSEYMYLQDHSCSNDGTWNTTQQSLLQHGDHSYDQLQVVCSTDGSKRSFYFDVTGFFGKL